MNGEFQLDLFGDYIDTSKYKPIDGNGGVEDGKDIGRPGMGMGRNGDADDLRYERASSMENDGSKWKNGKGNLEPVGTVGNGQGIYEPPVSVLPEAVQG